MKVAISLVIFKNIEYIIGGCIVAYLHKKFTKKLNIDIIVLVDDYIYKYKNILNKYFDKIIKIDLIKIKLNEKYIYHDKYSKWMNISINKWQILNLEEYDKVLYLDTDILPLNISFYDIFKIDTFGITILGKNNNFNKIVDKQIFLDDNKIFNYNNVSLKLKKSIDGSIVLVKPNKKLYQEYLEFLKICEDKNGYISSYYSGVDETTLLLFLFYYKNLKIKYISYDYTVILWEKFEYNIKNIKGLNYISYYKPWLLLPVIQWREQNIWHIIAKKAFKKSKSLSKLYKRKLIEYLIIFKNNHKDNNKFNLECLDSKYITKLFRLLENNKIEKVLKYNRKIHKYMNKKSLINFNKIIHLIN